MSDLASQLALTRTPTHLPLSWYFDPEVSFEAPDPDKIRWLPLAIVGVFALRGIGAYVAEFGMAWTGHRVVFDLRRALVDKLLRLPSSCFDAVAGALLQSKVTFDAYQLAGAASTAITIGLRSALGIAAKRRWIGYGMNHLDLLDSPEVYDRLRRWLA